MPLPANCTSAITALLYAWFQDNVGSGFVIGEPPALTAISGEFDLRALAIHLANAEVDRVLPQQRNSL